MTSNFNENNIPATNLKTEVYSGMLTLPLNWQFENCITKEQLAQHLQVSISHINKLMSEDGLPRIKVGRAVRFRLDEIYGWLQKKGHIL